MALLKKTAEAQPIVGQRSAETQPYGALTRYLIGLPHDIDTSDYLVSEVVRGNETQVWFVSEHIVDTPLVRAR